MSVFRSQLGPRFWRLWAATGVSSLGDGMVLVGFPLLALSYTHSYVLIAGVAVAGRLPALVVALPAGALADRVNRRRFLMGIEASRAVALAGFVGLLAVGAGSLAFLYAAVFVLGALNAAFEFASAASLPTLVGPGDLVTANANLLTVDLTAKEMLGQAVGGFAFAAARTLPFLADAVSFAASAAILSKAIPDNPPAPAGTSLTADLKFGLKWFLRSPLVRLLTGLVASLAFCQALVLGLLVLYGTQDLHLSKVGYGLLLGVAAVGNAVGAVGAKQLHARLGSGWCIVLAGISAAAAYPVLALTSSPIAAGGALALEAIAVMVGNVAARSLRQRVVPQALQGRVASAYQMVILGALPLGGLVGGLLASGIGIRSTFLVAGGLQVAVLALVAPRLLVRTSRRPTGKHWAPPVEEAIAA